MSTALREEFHKTL